MSPVRSSVNSSSSSSSSSSRSTSTPAVLWVRIYAELRIAREIGVASSSSNSANGTGASASHPNNLSMIGFVSPTIPSEEISLWLCLGPLVQSLHITLPSNTDGSLAVANVLLAVKIACHVQSLYLTSFKQFEVSQLLQILCTALSLTYLRLTDCSLTEAQLTSLQITRRFPQLKVHIGIANNSNT